jgi:hypothetical protein
VIPHSLHITGTVGQWESWMHMQFPETGDYVFPAGLATVHIDRDDDTGEYWEPNIWIIHHATGSTPRLPRHRSPTPPASRPGTAPRAVVRATSRPV